MRNIFLYILLLMLNLLIGQTKTSLTINESPEYNDEIRTNNILSIHTSINGKTGIVRDSKKHLSFDIFDDNLKKEFSKLIESNKKETFVGELFHENEIKFFTVYAPKKTERILYCHVFNLKDKTHKKIKLFENIVEKKQSLFSGKNRHQTNFAISPNGNYFAISTDNIRKNINSYTIYVYDANNLELVYKQAYQEHENRFYVHNDIAIDNKATVYSLGKLFLNGNFQISTLNGNPNYQFILNKITKNGSKNLTLNLDEEHIQSLDISYRNNQLHLIGFYSEKNVNRIKGGCNFIINTLDFSIEEKKKHILPIKVYEDLYGYRKSKKKKDKELSRFKVDYVLNDDDGNTYLLAEEFYVTSQYVPGVNGAGYWQTIYHYDDILILKYNSLGDLDWGRSIFKRATLPSYNAFTKDNKLHIILNSGENLKEKKDGRIKASKSFFEGTALYDFVYSRDGEVLYSQIQNNRDKTLYLPNYGTFENDTFIMMSSGKKKKQFMILR